jgi:Methylase-associated X1
VLAGRQVPRVYRVSGRGDLHEFLLGAVQLSGGTVLYASDPNRVPVYIGLDAGDGQRVGLMVYPFRVTRKATRNRPGDEVRGQLRYGAEETWPEEDHFVARDIAGVDTTLLLGIYPEGGLILGLDPALYDPLPLGISVYAKDEHVEAVARDGWAVWEKANRAGIRRAAPRAGEGLETLVGLQPARLLDYARFERQANDLGLDQSLRYAAAVDAGRDDGRAAQARQRHSLEDSFNLSAAEILDIIHNRMRLEVAVKGGVAEHHLERLLVRDPLIAQVERLDLDAQPDFSVALFDGTAIRIECKNASPERYSNGDMKVEVQKTRATRDDPAGRLYKHDHFDVVAACLYSPTREWTFKFIRTCRLDRHPAHYDRLAATHRIDSRSSGTLEEALAQG